MQIFCVVERIGCGESSPTFHIFPCTSPQPHALSPLPNPAPSRESLLRTLVRQLAWGAKRCPEATESVLSATAVRLRNGSPTGVFGGLRRQRRRDLLGGEGLFTCFQEEGRDSLFRLDLGGRGMALHGGRSAPQCQHPITGIFGERPHRTEPFFGQCTADFGGGV